VGYGERSDAELVELSQAGVAPAFAVLLHRHGPAVRSAVRHDPDPTGAVIETFVRAMRELPTRDPKAPVRPWLLTLTESDLPADPLVPLSEEERDEVWAELAVRWPSGRLPRRSDALQRVALVGGLIAVSALVPTLVLLAGQDDPEPLEELRAFPLQSVVEVAEPEEAEPLPSFTFPTVPELEGPATTAPEPTVTAEPSPTPTPTPTPTPQPQPEPEPEPAPEPEPTTPPEDEGGDEEEDGGGSLLPLPGGGGGGGGDGGDGGGDDGGDDGDGD
jgi:hypothetical protein